MLNDCGGAVKVQLKGVGHTLLDGAQVIYFQHGSSIPSIQ